METGRALGSAGAGPGSHPCLPCPGWEEAEPLPHPTNQESGLWYRAKLAGSQTVPPQQDKLGGLVIQNLGPSLGGEKTSPL